jgi:hypothetical protein
MIFLAQLWWQTPGLFGSGVAIVSASFTAFAIWMVWQKFAPMQAIALATLTKAQEELTATQGRHIVELKLERDDSREKLQKAREVATDLALKESETAKTLALQLKEMESRPDLSSLSALLTRQNEILDRMLIGFEEHRTELMKILPTLVKRSCKREAKRKARRLTSR